MPHQGVPADGAAPGAGEGNSAYRFGFRPLRGWWDPAGQTAALYYGGRLNFRYWDHGIDFDTARGKSYVRLSFAGPTSDIDEAVTRIGAWIHRADQPPSIV